VALASEIPDNTPMQVLVAAEAWVVTRMDGVLTAFEDRCPHRQSPLSAGSVTRTEDGSPRLVCAVHGWRFDPAGQCDLMPTEGRHGRGGHRGHGHHARPHGWHGRHGRHGDDRTPDAVRLRRAYGITERYGLVWLAVDEPLAPLPEFPEWDADGMDRAHGRPVRVQASAGQVIDSLLSAGTVAASTVAVSTATVSAPEPGGWAVTGVAEGSHEDGARGPGAVRRTTTAGPGATVHQRLELPHATVGILVAAQPEEWGATRVFRLIARDDLGGDPALAGELAAGEDRALAEDLAPLKGHAAALLPLDEPDEPGKRDELAAEDAPGPGLDPASPASPLGLAWRRLMARAVRASIPSGHGV
jgi:vanillate O-demethylase monooxygenase subunit